VIGALHLWVRRGSVTLAIPALIGAGLVVLMSRRGWWWDPGWAYSHASTPVILIAPLLAGLVAFDRSRPGGQVLALLAANSPRERSATAVPPTAGWLAALATCAALAGGVAVALIARSTGALPSGWLLLEVVTALAAAAAVGWATGRLLPNRAAGPVAALGVYLLGSQARSWGLAGLFAPGGATGMLAGVERNPTVSLTLVSLHVVIAAAGAMVGLTALHQSRRRLLVRAAVAAAVLLIAVGASSTLVKGQAPYRFSSAAPVCVGSTPRVCGPASAQRLLTVSAQRLSEESSLLSGSGIPLQQEYRLAIGPTALSDAADAGAGLLTVTPEEFVDGRPSVDDLAATVSRPRMCPQYVAAQPPVVLLEAQQRVQAWVVGTDGAATSQPAPTDVVAAYHRLVTCDRDSVS
jgi:hypothetical protein